MERKVYMVAGLAFLVVALASFGVYARGMMGKSQSLSCDRADLLGTLVKDSRGDLIGIVYRVENDGGQSFAIINHGLNPEYGEWVRYTPVPVGALKIAKFSKSNPSDDRRTQQDRETAGGRTLLGSDENERSYV